MLTERAFAGAPTGGTNQSILKAGASSKEKLIQQPYLERVAAQSQQKFVKAEMKLHVRYDNDE